MGTYGVKVIRDRGVYYVWYRSNTGYPRGLGLEMHRMVPADPRVFSLWRSRLRKKLVALRHAYNAHEAGRAVSSKYQRDFESEEFTISKSWDYEVYNYIYELDLDNRVFLFNRCPMYHLDNLPPEDVFCVAEDAFEDSSDIHQARQFYQGIPKEYRFDLARLKGPLVKPKKIKTYERLCTDIVTDPRSIVLPLPNPELSRAEDLALHLLAEYVGFYLRTMAVPLYHDMALTNDTLSDRHWRGQELAWLFVAMSLFPLHIVGQPQYVYDTAWSEFFSGAGYEFWFIRKHICVTLGTCLLDEHNTEYHISRLVDKIIHTADAPAVTYGVVFSLFHCVVVRVDKAAGGRFSRTEVLEFLPESPMIIGERRITRGMETLIRLRNAPSEDELQVFHSWLSYKWWDLRETIRRCRRFAHLDPNSEDQEAGTAEVAVQDVIPESTPSPPGPQLPIELLTMIVSLIEDPEDLFHFALLSRMHMAAAIPRLWRPQVWGDPERRHRGGHILEAREPNSSPAIFHIRHGDRPALLRLSYLDSMRGLPDRRMALRFMDGKNTMPRANVNIRPAGIRQKSFLHWRMPPHPELGFYTWWGPEMVRELRESLEERIVQNGGTLPADLENIKEAIRAPHYDEDDGASLDESEYEHELDEDD